MPAMQQSAQILVKHSPTHSQPRMFQHFRQIHHRLDVGPILAELDAQTNLRDQHPERHLAPGSLLTLRIGSGGLVPCPAVVDAAAGRSRGEARQHHSKHQPAV